MRILVVEDDAPLASFVRKGLEAEHYAVDVAPDGELARLMAVESEYDLLILDLNLPKLDGISVLNAVRPKKPSLPVLVLTARSRVEDRVQSLDTGADDCLIKPFSFTELAARVRALLRRGPRTVEAVLRVADLDEEASNLLLYQRAYQAAAQAITTVNQMLEAVMNMGASSS
jgi:two-component system copper resistance phosphate regulon response regulator CusR